MTKITIVNKKTVFEKLAFYSVISLLSIFTYTAYSVVGSIFDKSHKQSNYSRVIALVERNNFSEAEQLLEKLLKQNSLTPKDEIRLEKLIQEEKLKQEKQRELDEILNEENFDLYREILEQSRNILGDKIEVYEKKLLESTEEGLWNLINMVEDSVSRKKYCEIYLTKYPEGIHKKEIITTDLLIEFDEMVNSLSEGFQFDLVMKELNEFKEFLEKYKAEPVILKELIEHNLINIDEFLNKVLSEFNDYVDFGTKLFRKGNFVRTYKTNIEKSRRHIGYILRRDSEVEIGQVGEIINYNEPFYIVHFPNAESERKTAGYLIQELKHVRPAETSERFLLEQKLNELRTVFEKDY